MRLQVSFTNYEASDVGKTETFQDVWRIERLKKSQRLVIQTSDSTARHAFNLTKIADIEVSVRES